MRVDAVAWKYVSRTPAGRSRTAMGMPGVTNTSHFKGSELIAERYGTRASASRTKKPRIRPPRSARFGWGIVLGHASRGPRGRRRFSDHELRRGGGIRCRQHL